MSHYILGTAGHIDHGKSSLVQALSGTDPDRLPEEKSRGMTITLGFAHIALPSPGGPAFEIGIVDVPGHADFIRQMVFGAAGIDLALLVVAADDGWMPQTEEHLQILHYLGVQQAVVAVTKSDLSDDPEFIVECVREELIGSEYADAPVVAVSATDGKGIDTLRTTLSETFDALPEKKDRGKPRLACDRVFSPKGVGTVVTGTLTGGALSRGQAVRLLPEGLPATVRSLQNHNHVVETALPGMRTAVQLGDVSLAAPGHPGARRGQVLVLPDFDQAPNVIDIEVQRTARTHQQLGEIPGPRNRQRVAVQHAGGAVLGRLLFRERAELGLGERDLARLRLESPLPVFEGDRLLLRDAGHHHTLAGAVVLDAFPPPGPFSRPARQAFLAARAEALANNDPMTFLRARLERDRVVDLAEAFAWSPFSAEEADRAATELEKDGQLTRTKRHSLHRPWWEEALLMAEKTVDTHHRKRPDEPGLPLENLRRALADAASERTVFDALLKELTHHGIVRNGPIVHRDGHRPHLAAGLMDQANRLRKELRDTPLAPPNRKDLPDDPQSQKILRFFMQSGEVIELDEKHIIHRDGFEAVRDAVVSHLRAHPGARAADLRDISGVSRKLLMPMLEIFDARGITHRDGDLRSLSPKAESSGD